ncbi:hypothetical protein A2U01_0071072, partial [Trifolium medium]|nr:hypothetical protein [Trifolium medium]
MELMKTLQVLLVLGVVMNDKASEDKGPKFAKIQEDDEDENDDDDDIDSYATECDAKIQDTPYVHRFRKWWS